MISWRRAVEANHIEYARVYQLNWKGETFAYFMWLRASSHNSLQPNWESLFVKNHIVSTRLILTKSALLKFRSLSTDVCFGAAELHAMDGHAQMGSPSHHTLSRCRWPPDYVKQLRIRMFQLVVQSGLKWECVEDRCSVCNAFLGGHKNKIATSWCHYCISNHNSGLSNGTDLGWDSSENILSRRHEVPCPASEGRILYNFHLL